MNIEEERKAFLHHTALDSNVYNHEFTFWLKAKAETNKDIQMLLKICAFETIEQAYAYAAGVDVGEVKATVAQQFYDEGFAAGVKNAEEMAKPECYICCDFDGEFWLVSLKGREGPGFATAEAGRVWATSNGYRVVEDQPKESVSILKLSGGEGWHVCLLVDRVWKGIDLNVFARKGVARKWAEDNSYRVIEE